MRTGSASCETLARDVLGADLESPDFWTGAIDSLAGAADQLDALLPALPVA
jgi:oligoendopeptidase F